MLNGAVTTATGTRAPTPDFMFAHNDPKSALCDAAHTLERLGAESRLGPAGAAWRQLSVEAATAMDALRDFDGVREEATL